MVKIFKPRFIREFKAIRNYIRGHTVLGAEKFASELENLVLKKIPSQPFSFPEFKKKPTTAKVYRKAIFKKKWNVIYKVEPNRIVYIAIYYSRRNVDRMRFEG